MAEQTTLLERNTAGLQVELRYLPLMDMVVLACRTDGDEVGCSVAPERALDAFDHPTTYLNDAQVDRLFPRRP